MKSKKYLSVAFAGLFCSLFVATGLAMASAEKEISEEDSGLSQSPVFELRANDKGLAYNKESGYYEFVYTPGAKLKDSFYVNNLSGSATLKLKFAVQDGYFSKDKTLLFATGEDQYHLGKWTSVLNEFTLEPGSSQEVPFTVTLPSVASPANDFYGAIFVSVSQNGTAVAAASQFGIKMKISSSSKDAPKAALISKLSKVADAKTYAEFSLKIKNDGNTFWRGTHELVKGDKALDEAAIGLMPGEIFEKKIDLAKKFGFFTLYSRFESVEGEMTENKVGEYFFFPHVFFYILMFLVFVGAGVGAFFLYKKNPKYAAIFGGAFLLLVIVLLWLYYPRSKQAPDDRSVILSSEDEVAAKKEKYVFTNFPEAISLKDVMKYELANVFFQNTDLIREGVGVEEIESVTLASDESDEVLCEELPDPIEVMSELNAEEGSFYEMQSSVLGEAYLEDCSKDAPLNPSKTYNFEDLALSELIFAEGNSRRVLSALELYNKGDKVVPLEAYKVRVGIKELSLSGVIAAKQRKLIYLNKELGDAAFDVALKFEENNLGAVAYDPTDPHFQNSYYDSYALALDGSVFEFMAHSTPFKENAFYNERPKALFELADWEHTPEGVSLKFSAENSSDADGDELEYYWIFGDDKYEGKEIEFIANNSGLIIMQLKVIDPFGAIDIINSDFTVERNFELSDAPLITFNDNLNDSSLTAFINGRVVLSGMMPGSSRSVYLEKMENLDGGKTYLTVSEFSTLDGKKFLPVDAHLLLNGVKIYPQYVSNNLIFDISDTLMEMKESGISDITPILFLKSTLESAKGDYSADLYYTVY